LAGKDLDVKAMTNAEIISRPNYLEGRDQIAGLWGGKEEAFPTSSPARIPLLGRFFKASENAFTGSANRLRASLFDNFMETQKKMGADVNDPIVIKDAGALALSMTSRAKQGKVGSVLLNRTLFWAPRMVKSSWNVLTGPINPKISSFQRQQYAVNLLKYVAFVTIVKTASEALVPGSTTNEPRATDFKNLKYGDTRISIGRQSQRLAGDCNPDGRLSARSAWVWDSGGAETGTVGDRCRWEAIRCPRGSLSSASPYTAMAS